MPTGIELYGRTEGLDATTISRIQSGFDEIRSISGWENFRIPAYVWDYVDQNERDQEIAFLESVLFSSTTPSPLAAECPALTAELHFAFVYTLFLYLEWWRDNPDKPYEYYLSQMYTDDIGIPDSSIYITNMYTDVLGVTVYHPLSSQLSNPWDVGDWWVTKHYSDKWGYITVGYDDCHMQKYVDTDEGAYCCWFDGYGNLIQQTDWDDLGEIAVWAEYIEFPNSLVSLMSTTNITETKMDKYLNLNVELVSFGDVTINEFSIADLDMSGNYILNSEYIVYANLINLNQDEFCEYSFIVDDPTKITIISQHGNTFRFYMRNNEKVNVTSTATVFRYENSDFTKTIINEVENTISVGDYNYAPIYGITDEMDPEIQHKLEHGIYKLREISIFKHLQIPMNVWNYVDIKVRDKLLENIYNAIYENRNLNDHFGISPSFSKDEIFTLTYIFHLMNVWYYKTPSDKKPMFLDFDSDYISTNWGISNLNENINGNIKTFSLDLNPYLGDINLYFEIENDTELSSKSRIDYMDIGNNNYTELYFTSSLNDSYFKDAIEGIAHVYNFIHNEEYTITTNNYVTFYNEMNIYKPDFYEIPYYVSCIIDNEYGISPFTYNWTIESEGQYFYLENDKILSLAILTPDVNYNVTCVVEDDSGYTREISDTIFLDSSISVPSKMKSNIKIDFNFFKGKIKIPFAVPDENKDTILTEINLYTNKNINLLLTYMRQNASNGKFVDKVTSVKDIVVNNKYFLHTIDFDENEIFFYLKCANDYSPTSAINRIYNIIYHVMTLHGYMIQSGGITIEYEPVLYSERIVEDMKIYLDRMWKTKYYNVNLQDAFNAMQNEVDLFIGSRTKYYDAANFTRTLYKR